MEAYREAADAAAKRRRALIRAHDTSANVVVFPTRNRLVETTEFGTGWYHAAAIEDERSRPRKF